MTTSTPTVYPCFPVSYFFLALIYLLLFSSFQVSVSCAVMMARDLRRGTFWKYCQCIRKYFYECSTIVLRFYFVLFSFRIFPSFPACNSYSTFTLSLIIMKAVYISMCVCLSSPSHSSISKSVCASLVISMNLLVLMCVSVGYDGLLV